MAVDTLAREVDCPVLVEDSRHQPLWWSAQTEVDPVRLRTLLERSVAPEAASMVRSLRLASMSGPVRTPVVPEIGMRERWCVPLHSAGQHLGYLWVIDGDGVVTEAQLPDLVACADVAAKVIAQAAPTQAERTRRRATLLDRLARGPDEDAARMLIDLDRLPHDVEVVAWFPPRDGGWEVAGCSVHTSVDVGPGDLAPTSGKPLPLVGISRAVHRAHAVRRALAAGALLPQPTWESLGAWRLVTEASDDLSPGDIHPAAPRVLALVNDDRAGRAEIGRQLALTARAMLDHGGDAAATAASLSIHRTTLYYRLDRLQELTGVDLRESEGRTDLQLALWLAAYRETR